MASYKISFTLTTSEMSHPRKWLLDTIGEALELGEDLFNYDCEQIDTVEYMGKTYDVLAVFPEEAQDKANEFMLRHEEAAVLAIIDGLVYLANVNDKGR